MICEDTAFYWHHRMLHTPFFYKKIHKLHHEYYNTISLSSLYAHPIEFFFGNLLPFEVGVILLGSRIHMVTFLIWTIIRIFETIDGHCGYEFSWSPYRLLPLSGSSEYHNFHHSNNIGVYASFFTYWDTIMGTNKEFYQYKAKKEKERYLN